VQSVPDRGQMHEHEVMSQEKGARQVDLDEGHKHEQLLESR